MSVAFAGAGHNEYDIGATGGLAAAGFFGTVLIGAKITTTTDNSWQSFIEGENSIGSVVLSTGRRNTGALYYANQGALDSSVPIDDSLGHMLVAITKATGTAPAVQRVIPLATGTPAAGTTTQTFANSSSIANGVIKLGGDDDPLTGLIWLAAILPGVVLTPTQIDAIAAAKTTQSILDLSNANSWVVDAADDLATDYKGNHNRTATTGATHSTDDPAGWVFGEGGAAGPTYDDTPSGSATPGASIGESIAFSDAASGDAAAVGGALEGYAHSNSPVGAAAPVGGALEDYAHSNSPVGAAAPVGSLVDAWLRGFTDTPVGTASPSGLVSESHQFDDVVAGQAITTGALSEGAVRVIRVPSSSIAPSAIMVPGSSAVQYSDAPSGTAAASGSTDDSIEYSDEILGVVGAQGILVDGLAFDDAPVGEAQPSGSVVENTGGSAPAIILPTSATIEPWGSSADVVDNILSVLITPYSTDSAVVPYASDAEVSSG